MRRSLSPRQQELMEEFLREENGDVAPGLEEGKEEQKASS
jgi:hypothetical protein